MHPKILCSSTGITARPQPRLLPIYYTWYRKDGRKSLASQTKRGLRSCDAGFLLCRTMISITATQSVLGCVRNRLRSNQEAAACLRLGAPTAHGFLRNPGIESPVLGKGAFVTLSCCRPQAHRRRHRTDHDFPRAPCFEEVWLCEYDAGEACKACRCCAKDGAVLLIPHNQPGKRCAKKWGGTSGVLIKQGV
jgi:hypothetical protein